ncbi:hypothetical protein niasHS_015326 [Heterodera schachtii]|uniref:Uncharacterized protein n=1 Tax=Heterodera schachtii TaxID=97005 RepID=A0ABD2I5F2_HETSC
MQFVICLTGMEKFEKVRVNEKNFVMVKNLHGNWYSAGLKAIIGKLGNELYKKLRNDEQKQLEKCLDNIEDKRDLVMSSQCLTKFRKNYLREMNREKMKKEEKKAKKIGAFTMEQQSMEKEEEAQIEISNERNAKQKQ